MKPGLIVSNLLAHGFAIGLNTLTGLEFSPHHPHTYCRICGAVYQSPHDRNPQQLATNLALPVGAVLQLNTNNRKGWSQKHASEHSENEHKDLALSGRWCTPDAAFKLGAFGIFSLIDLTLDDEVSAALKESSPIPKDDVEGI
jgi:hypothetical protein